MSRFVGVLSAFAFAWFPLATSAQQSGTVNGQTFVPVSGWEPGDFRISCGNYTGVMSPNKLSLSCLGQNQASILEFEVSLISAASYLENKGFVKPYHFGPVISGFENNSQPAVRIFTVNDPTIFALVEDLASSTTVACNPEGYRVMGIDPSTIGTSTAAQKSFVAAHELYHTVQPAVPNVMVPSAARYVNCYPPEWITESMADAVGIDFMRREHSNAFPPRLGQPSGSNIAGLRPYQWPLHFQHSTTDYNTNSFWLYLGDQFHNKTFKFLDEYTSNPAPFFTSGGKEDWLRWLDDRVKGDPKISMPLYLVYPRFLTHFAGEWVKGGVGQYIGRQKWLTRAFGGCSVVNISPQNPYAETELKMNVMGGRCLSVRVSGLDASDLASVKVGALTEDLQLADSLHLGFAFTTDKTGFNCAQATREGKLPKGRVGCLLEPSTGGFETDVASMPAARMWHASSLEKGAGAQSEGADGDDIENVYILSYVPVEPWEEAIIGREKYIVNVGVGLDWSTLSVDGSNVNSGSSDGRRSSPRTRSAAAMGISPLETDRMIPPSIGHVDSGPLQTLLGNIQTPGDGDYSISDLLQRKLGGNFGTEVGLFRLAKVDVIPIDDVIPQDQLEVVSEFMVMTDNLLPLGTVGTFDAGISGTRKDDPFILYYSPENAPAKLTVIENSNGAFHAKVDGIVCEMNMAGAQFGKIEECRQSFFVSGEFTKPFAYLYRAETELKAELTRGEEIYDEYSGGKLGLANLFSNLTGGNSSSSASSPTSTSESSGGAVQCQCACPNVVTPASDRCVGQCYAQLQSCEAVPETMSPVDQMEKFTDLLNEQELPRDVSEMLISDFSNMSSETREYIIEQFSRGNM